MSPNKSQHHLFTKQDLLNRESSADDLLNLVNMMNKCARYNLSLSIAIDSRWGSGITFFLNILKNYILEVTQFHDKVVYYNAWEFDDSESTLIPIVYSIVNGLDNIPKETAEEAESPATGISIKNIAHYKMILKIIGASAVRHNIHSLLGDNDYLRNILQKGVDEASEKELSDLSDVVDKFNSYYEYRKNLTEALKALKPENGQLWIFIDDLDRCKPSFALETLEDIKHFFDIEGLVFVFAVDMNQLSFAVRKNYGKGVNTNSYVRKFFDYIYLLPSPNLKAYLNGTFHQDGRELLLDNSLSFLCTLYEEYDYSLREINQNISHLYSFLDRHSSIIQKIREDTSDNADEGFRIYLFFMIIRDKFHHEYQRIIKGHFTIKGSTGSKYKVFEQSEFNSLSVNKFLEAISDDGVSNWAESLKEEYKLFNIAIDGSFEKHMETVLA